MSIQLMPWNPDDCVNLEELYANADQTHCLVCLRLPLEKDATVRYLEGVRRKEIDGNPFYCYAVMLEDRIIGKIELTVQEDRFGELDVILRRDCCGKGNGTQAVRSMIALAAKKQWCRGITAYTDAENAAIQAVLEKNGFQKQRRFQADVLVPSGNTYYLRPCDGIEYVRFLSGKDANA